VAKLICTWRSCVCTVQLGFFLLSHFQFMYSIGDMFSPLDTVRFEDGSSQHVPSVYSQTFPRTSFSMLKSSSSFSEVFGNTESVVSTSYSNSMSEIKKEIVVKDAELLRRGWRFYGTFACLALLNLICAIDATILAVALPVRSTVQFMVSC